MNGPDTLAEIVTAPWRDEKALARAAQAVRFYRAIADAIENDPDLAPEMLSAIGEGHVSTNAQFFVSRDVRSFLRAAIRLLHADPVIDKGSVEVSGEVGGVPVSFHGFLWDLPKRKRVEVREVEVEEYVLDDEFLSDAS